ncbi:hypothetical protein E3N88_43267 [Mikania micrantha]|uniref:Defective in cullin neddylation protein n=1 Tax=Mikania micrantha TaxID=192012 RepID=A0A5N6LG87_9ASTR|nr:hypothetical protein E3N88_43267 [Mikania micrantha]
MSKGFTGEHQCASGNKLWQECKTRIAVFLVSEMICRLKNSKKGICVFIAPTVLGIITQILLHNSSHCFFGFNILLLLTFDECHYAQVESNHSFAEIMKVYTVESREELDQFVSSPQINYYYYGDFVERNDVIEQNEQCSDDVLCGSYLSLVAASFLTQCKKEGVEKLCSDLSVEHTDARVLMLAWKMNAKKQGYFTQIEFPELKNYDDYLAYS